jgi:xylulokinase
MHGAVRPTGSNVRRMPLVAGIDSSTQSTKVEIRDLDTGRVLGRGSSPHPLVTPPVSEQAPGEWWSALELAYAQAVAVAGLAESGAIAAVSVGGQQHGMVAVDGDDRPVHPAKLWNDTESAPDAEWLIGQMGGGELGRRAFVDAVGSVPVASMTVTKLSWLHRRHPTAWERMARVMLPHDYLTMRMTGRFVTDRGDASGTGYWSPTTGAYCYDVLSIIDAGRDWSEALPSVLGPLESAGEWRGSVVGPGTGDNMAAAMGVGLRTGHAVVSAGTSGTAFAVSDTPSADVSGEVAGFADATGRYLPLVCTLNAAKVVDAVARLLGVDHAGFDELAIAAPDGDRVTLLPYFDGERTPNRPGATGVLGGLRTDVTREDLARATLEGVACGLVDALDSLRSHAPVDGRVMLVGGLAQSTAFRRVLAGLVDVPIVVSDADQAVATGAAVQAAAVLERVEPAIVQERWGLGSGTIVTDPLEPGNLRERYAELRDRER